MILEQDVWRWGWPPSLLLRWRASPLPALPPSQAAPRRPLPCESLLPCAVLGIHPPACCSASGVPPIAAPDQTSPVQAFPLKMSVWKGILPGPFSHTPRWLCQVLKGVVPRGGPLPSVGRAWELQPRLLQGQVSQRLPATRAFHKYLRRSLPGPALGTQGPALSGLPVPAWRAGSRAQRPGELVASPSRGSLGSLPQFPAVE